MSAESAVRIGLVLPDLLGTYGDSGNALVLRRRLEWRGIRADMVRISGRDAAPTNCDIYLLGGGEDDSQAVAAQVLRSQRTLSYAVDHGAVVFAVCAGMQVLGSDFVAGDGRRQAGVELLDITTTARERRAVGEIVVRADKRWGLDLLTGFENHQGATTVGPAARPLGAVLTGVGNGAGQPSEGVVQGRCIGTYLHGPALARNPDLADLLLSWATGTRLSRLPVGPVERLRRDRLKAAHVRPGPTRRIPGPAFSTQFRQNTAEDG